MTEKSKTCQVVMYEADVCGRQVYDDKGMCICHSEREDKDISLFQKELDKIFNDDKTNRYDFTKFIFPKEDWSFQGREFDKDSIFVETKFLGNANFHYARFSNANFVDSEFSGNADFVGAQFCGKAYFTNVCFSGEVNFDIAQFCGEAYFYSTTFVDYTSFHMATAKSSTLLKFDGESINENLMWKKTTYFQSFKIEKEAVITFRKVSMRDVQLLESNISRMEFIDVDWPRTSRWHKRRTVADEMIDGKKDYSLIAQIYQGLQENYAGTYRYLEAGDFFVGEQEMRRRGRGRWRQYFSLNNAYRLLSYYGQSMLLPLFWLLGVLLLIPSFLMYGGVATNLQNKSEVVDYEWSFYISDFLLLKADYWQTFLFNFSFMAFSRSKMHDALTEPWQLALVNFEALVVIGLVAMSLLAVRRRFKRKNF